MKKLYTFLAFVLVLASNTFTQAQQSMTTTYSNVVPIVSNVTSTSATVSVPPNYLLSIPTEERSQIYFEYSETNQVCIMIYPTPENCQPKRIMLEQYQQIRSSLMPQITNTGVILKDLKTNTSYTIVLKRDNTINCITTPCPGNEFQSNATVFITLPVQTTSPLSGSGTITRNLSLGMRGTDVIILQNALRDRGYFTAVSTGYYGAVTRASVRAYQRSVGISATGTVGPLTRAALFGTTIIPNPILPVITEETFEGTVTAVSTDCFFDGTCSVSVDGKKIVTTIGWSQEIGGMIRGAKTDIGSIVVGDKVKVYAKKTPEGYTLYGNANYYVEIYQSFGTNNTQGTIY